VPADYLIVLAGQFIRQSCDKMISSQKQAAREKPPALPAFRNTAGAESTLEFAFPLPHRVL
jgi:hypothetical protein